MKQLLICTQNKNKIKEIKNVLKSFELEILSLKDLNDCEEIDEGGKTFFENAFIKAQYYGLKHNILALADDSGLEVFSLGMKPGIHSHRYAKTTEERNEKILFELKNKTERKAQFRTVLALFNPQTKQTSYFQGIIEGEISYSLKGDGGFGYDPLFYLKSFNKTLAELTLEEKIKISHRGLALKNLKEFLNENLDYL